ncbi:MAG: hypothetical protein M1816_006719 [Peltula sp. TS41687]|nr:MAG: hypothetical protein M1816_006719 [Peltula sp. TS41687]
MFWMHTHTIVNDKTHLPRGHYSVALYQILTDGYANFERGRIAARRSEPDQLLQKPASYIHKYEHPEQPSSPVEPPKAPEAVSKVPFAFAGGTAVVELPGQAALAKVLNLDTPTSTALTSLEKFIAGAG